MIVYVTSYDDVPLSYEDWRDEGLTLNMRRRVKEELESRWSWGITIPSDEHYRYVLQLTVDGVEVDLLLLPECVPGGAEYPAWEQHQLLMQPVYDDPEGAVYDQLRERGDSAALTEYLKSISDEVKAVVRIIKAWYKLSVCEDPDTAVGSVALETLVLAASARLESQHSSGSKRRPSAKLRGNAMKVELFLEALRLIDEVVTHGSVVMVDAGEWGYRRELGMRCARNWENDKVKIIHPIDPTCNLARPRKHKLTPDWQGLVLKARELLHIMEEGTLADVWHASTLGLTLNMLALHCMEKVVHSAHSAATLLQRVRRHASNGTQRK
ncbi:hypothetical protein GPECTOR_67g292 [Gonium pectorale]|uniref:Uncharacterized protein n=1 Tax=Gonium pectorale TaxID=33097 RepID=A0A150G3J2_GONPE|nr:hypothetical protein GPECTOR_67g292 [Gonium pectorale]|eukprot:KXZ44452.1 hypothetical protein GPECTOR_67g292 [Gonium pectorale]